MLVKNMDRPGRLKHLLVSFPQIEEIIDQKKRVRVTVTKQDSDQGIPKSPKRCALARACRRELRVDGAVIGVGYSYLIKGKKAFRFATSDTVAREVVSFDRHKDFAPGNYLLSPVSKSARLGSSNGVHTNTGNGSPKKNTHRIVHKRSARARLINA
jgi:hypothetical protein